MAKVEQKPNCKHATLSVLSRPCETPIVTGYRCGPFGAPCNPNAFYCHLTNEVDHRRHQRGHQENDEEKS